MNAGGLLEASKEFGLRFSLVAMLPAGVLALFLLALVWSGTPAAAPDLDRIVAEANGLGGREATLLVLALLVAALIFQPLQLPLVQLLEGYWGSSIPARLLARPALGMHRRRRARLAAAQTAAGSGAPETAEQKARRDAAGWRLRRLYPARDRVLPTALGNALRAAEDRAGGRYGLDAVIVWPRLYPLLPDRITVLIDDRRNQLDGSARFCVVFAIVTVVSLVLLAGHGWWLAVPAVAFLLSWLSYRGAVASAVGYGEAIEAAFDLHRFDLIRALHLPLPDTRESERDANRQLCEFLGQGVPIDFAYKHGSAAETADATASCPPAGTAPVRPPRPPEPR